MPASKKLWIGLILILIIMIGGIQFFLQDSNNFPSDDDSLCQDAPFPIGVATQSWYLKEGHEDSDIYRTTLFHSFNSISPEFEFKQYAINGERDVFDFNGSDYLVNFAQENNLRMHAHTLIWDESLPEWMNDLNPTDFTNYTKKWVKNVVTRYKGNITSYDVVNEAFYWNGTGFSFEPTSYLEKMGPDYIADMFRYTHSLDPDALLFYSDYGLRFTGQKLDVVKALIKNLLDDGVPIHGIGIHMHYTNTEDAPDLAEMQAALTELADLGLLIHISEMDVVANDGSHLWYDNVLKEEQQRIVEDIVTAYFSVPEDQQYGITLWGLRDGDSWQNDRMSFPVGPLLFDNNCNPKPAYYGFLEVLKEYG
ncbi:MAG: hypothetical protein GF411_15695 [Candidatus Lokiarchaeota archaeon]|nr:hypothetical protein [Candidatus Lokiarchaeota archaeon]